MKFWWVNQNQTFSHEVDGGYLWSPKRKSNNALNPYYEFMREVAPGDLILSYHDTRIKRIGVSQSYCYECPKPSEFGTAGPNWSEIGWKLDVKYFDPINYVRPAEHMDILRPLLPAKYSPLSANGKGSQAVYLTSVPAPLMNAVALLVGPMLRNFMTMTVQRDEIPRDSESAVKWQEHLERELEQDDSLQDTVKEQLVLARRGQGVFKKNVRLVEQSCRITKVDRLEHLRASHIRPWRDADNELRLCGENGLLLTPSVDHLFDRGFISFEDNGRLLISPRADRLSLNRMGIETESHVNVGRFSEEQRKQMDYHRSNVFLAARINAGSS